MRIVTILTLSLVAPMIVGTAPASAAGRCLQWQFFTQKPAVCKMWSGSVAGGPKPTRLPKDAMGKGKCPPGMC
jgi:hypothetical protein